MGFTSWAVSAGTTVTDLIVAIARHPSTAHIGLTVPQEIGG